MVKKLSYSIIEEQFHPDNINPQPSSQIVVYLFSHAASKEQKPTRSLDLENHTKEIGEYEETLTEIESIGWIKTTEDTISLTLTGVQIAAPLYGKVINSVRENSSE
jgi:hypothetical protein